MSRACRKGASHHSPASGGRGWMKTRPPDSVEQRRRKHASEGGGVRVWDCIIAFKLHEGRFDFSLVRLPHPPAYRQLHKKKSSLNTSFLHTSCSLTQQTDSTSKVGKLQPGGHERPFNLFFIWPAKFEEMISGIIKPLNSWNLIHVRVVIINRYENRNRAEFCLENYSSLHFQLQFYWHKQ